MYGKMCGKMCGLNVRQNENVRSSTVVGLQDAAPAALWALLLTLKTDTARVGARWRDTRRPRARQWSRVEILMTITAPYWVLEILENCTNMHTGTATRQKPQKLAARGDDHTVHTQYRSFARGVELGS